MNPALLLPLHSVLGEARFWAVIGLLGLPSAIVLLILDRVADRPERLRGRSDEPPDPALLSTVSPEG